jgi:hypothetical protein
MAEDTGVIAMCTGAVPEGWHLCDGTAHGSADLEAIIGSPYTPDMSDVFVRGAGTTPRLSEAGFSTAVLDATTMPAHAHAGATSSLLSADHTHSGTSGGMSANASHSHNANTGNQSATHYHGFAAVNTGTVSVWHSHSQLNVTEGTGGSADGSYVDTSSNTQSKTNTVGTSGNNKEAHVHSAGGGTTHGINANHTHTIATSAPSIAHTHTVLTSGASATHTHTVSGQGSGAAFSIMPAYYALSFVIKI